MMTGKLPVATYSDGICARPRLPNLSRRAVFAGLAGLVCSDPFATASAAPSFGSIPLEAHERAMRLAIDQARRNPRFPFGAVITRAENGDLLAKGVNNARSNPTLHGEIVCMNDYVANHGNKDWAEAILYTTAEPCAMCMSALVWSGIGGVVYASSIATVSRSDMGQNGINISARSVVDASPGYHGVLLGGILQAETDAMFMQRPRD